MRCGQFLSCVIFLSVAHARSFAPQQSTQTLLNSIDERLRSLQLDKSSSSATYRHASAAAIDQHMRKLESLEARIERFESLLAARLDRIEANMSVQHFKGDLQQDQILRKIDAIYERVHHKIHHIEMKIDANERKMTEKFESMLKKFQHLEDNIERRSAVEDEEVGEVFDALDEMKTTWHAGVENITQVVRRKFADFEGKDIHNLESIVNATRYDQQNAMRNLVVMVGRLGSKNSDCGGGGDGDAALGLADQLTAVARKIDARFDSLMQQQSVFADSCHRIQSDEPQLESKISEILEKMIDVFEKESIVEIKDIQNIEQLIKSHDTSVRRSLYTTSHNMAVLLQKAKEHKDDLALQVTAVHTAIEELARKVNDTPLSTHDIAKLFQDLRDGGGYGGSNASQVQVQKLLDAGAIDRNNIQIIVDELRKVSAQIAAFDIEALYKRIELLLVRYAERDLDAAIQQVFGPGPQATANATTTNAIVFAEIDRLSHNCTSGLLDVRMPLPHNCTICPPNNTNCSDAIKLPDDEEFLIDIRSESTNELENKTETLTSSTSPSTSIINAATDEAMAITKS